MESLRRSQAKKNPRAAGLGVFWPQDHPWDYIQHDTLKVFPHNVILLSSPISIWNIFQPMESLGSIIVCIMAFTNIDSVKSNIRVRDLEGIYIGL